MTGIFGSADEQQSRSEVITYLLGMPEQSSTHIRFLPHGCCFIDVHRPAYVYSQPNTKVVSGFQVKGVNRSLVSDSYESPPGLNLHLPLCM